MTELLERELTIDILERHARMVNCPHCGVVAGTPCKTSWGSHSSRFRAVEPYDFDAEYDAAIAARSLTDPTVRG